MSESTMTVNEYGDQEWRNDKGELHRDGDLPAVIWDDGTEFYFVESKRHRDGGLPAVIYADGSEFYVVEGKLHRAGGLPAVIRADGKEEFWENGVRIK